VVFSLFKKDPKPGKDGPAVRSSRGPVAPAADEKAAPGSASGNTASQSTRLNVERKSSSTVDLERQRARETFAKIDRIESEMARALAPANTDEPPTGSARSTVTRMNATGAATPRDQHTLTGEDGLGGNTDTFLNRANAIEITNLGSSPLIDEAAIGFANDQAAQSEILLRGGVERDELGSTPRAGWQMLLELLNQRDDRPGFEQLAQQYAQRFGEAAPPWHVYRLPPGAAAAIVEDPVVRLPAVLDAQLVQTLERLKQRAAVQRTLPLDASAVTRVDAAGAELLLRMLTALRRATHILKLYGAPALATALRAAVQTGRRDSSDACWMLRLELLRIAGQAAAFEEVAIDYCTTYEVSPPSWEPASANFILAAGPAPAPPAPAEEPAPSGPLHWVGVIGGDGQPWLDDLLSEASNAKRLQVDCLHLKRIEYGAASALLGQVLRLQSTGIMLHFDHVNPLVAALLQMLGLGEVAEIHPRR
jgi:anti-anti-sigma regulatory factor